MSAKEAKHAETIRGLSSRDMDLIGSLLHVQLDNIEASGLDPMTHALVRIAALVSIGAPPTSYMWQVRVALESGVLPEDIVGVLVALAPTIGMARIVEAAPELARALGLDTEALVE
jgi:4-carboxymuconolactone decarboxylase